MKRTLKLYSGDQGGTPGTPDRREKVKNFVVHIDEDDNASTQPQDDVPGGEPAAETEEEAAKAAEESGDWA